jgi:hypothetical protein
VRRIAAFAVSTALFAHLPLPASAQDPQRPAMTTESRRALESWAGCIARSGPGEAGRVLSMDFTTKTYDRALTLLADGGKNCVGWGSGTLRSAGLLFAGEMAEALIETSKEPVRNRLARAAAAPATKAFTIPDKMAICVVRSVPDQVAVLFASERGSQEETGALDTLAAPVAICAKAAEIERPLSISPAALRAMLATAAYRSIRSSERAAGA